MTTSQEVYNRAHAHFGNPELAREAAELYPGDFITEDDDEQFDPYDEQEPFDPPDCLNCDDRGCDQCDPETFPPEAPCNWCGRWFEVKLLTDDGLCTECEADRLQELKPRCVDCDTVAVDNTGDVCSYCQEWRDEDAKPRCCSCSQVHTDLKLSDGDICRECDKYYTSYYRWYKRLWRWVMRRQ